MQNFDGASSSMNTSVFAVDGVVFDLDGTLVDSCEDIAQAANFCLNAAGFPPRSSAEIQTFIGDGSRLLLARASGLEPNDERLDEMLERFFVYYTAHAVDHTTLLPGAREVLAALAHLPRGLCTNKPRVTTLALLEGLGIDGMFDVVVAAGDVLHHKPHPAPLQRASELLGVSLERLVLVGDGPQDVECARAAGARSIGITEGIIVPLERLHAAGPDALMALRDVPAQIASWRSSAGVVEHPAPETPRSA
ncbi:MAG TPA: HAD-IA family hydrolase [Polyangiaceae bacterium]|nr:HAD-IA family hydrolase [Polyangiaceae bacterium]